MLKSLTSKKFLPQEMTPIVTHRPEDVWYINGPPESPLVDTVVNINEAKLLIV